MLTWNQLKELVEAELKAKGLEDVEIWSIDLWQPDKINVRIQYNDYDYLVEEYRKNLSLRVSE